MMTLTVAALLTANQASSDADEKQSASHCKRLRLGHPPAAALYVSQVAPNFFQNIAIHRFRLRWVTRSEYGP